MTSTKQQMIYVPCHCMAWVRLWVRIEDGMHAPDPTCSLSPRQMHATHMNAVAM
jgi:hypothetical protein